MKEINSKKTDYQERKEAGFSLVEMVIALVILMIAVMGVFGAFAYSTKFNRGNSQRSQGLSVFQREIELLRSAKFTPSLISPELLGGVKALQNRTAIDNTTYSLAITVDDDPFVLGTQIDGTKTLKEITLEVTPQGADGAWVTANRIRVVLRRVQAN